MDIKTILAIIGEILIVISKGMSTQSAISRVASRHNLSESDVWDMWDKYGE